MNGFKLYSLLLVTIQLLYSCTDRYEASDSSQTALPMTIGAEISQNNVSRVTDSGFADGDCMGVFVVDYENGQPGKLSVDGNRANNFSFTFDEESNKWNSPYDIYWKDKITPVDVYGYYPYNSGLADVDSYRFEVSSDQSIANSASNMSNYEASDFLWAKAVKAEPGTSVIRLQYNHLMAGMSVVLEEGTGFSDSEWESFEKKVMVCNLVRVASVNLSTGKVSAAESAPDKHIVMADNGDSYRAVVVPQTVSATKPLLCINLNGTDYFFKKDVSVSLVGGKLHKFTIVVDKRTETGKFVLSLKSEEITEWENDEISHDFVTNAYVLVNCQKAGSLKESIVSAGHDYTTLKNLKVTGELTTEDFYFMRDEMPVLKALNLKEVKLKECLITDEGVEGTNYLVSMDDVIPNEAFQDKTSIKSFVFPQQLKRIGMNAFVYNTFSGDVIIPEGVTHIGSNAFSRLVANMGLVLPNSLEYIGASAFYDNKFNCEIKLPARLVYLGDNAFYSFDSGVYGNLHIPENLIYWGKSAFGPGASNLYCEDLVIPDGVSSIYEGAAEYLNVKRLVLHDGVTMIYSNAFSGGNISGELYLPSSIRMIGSYAFSEGKFTGSLKLPENLLYLGEGAFSNCSKLEGDLVLPSSLELVEASTFNNCTSIQSILIPEFVSYIGDYSFANCIGLKKITCMSKEPPVLGTDVFMNVDKNSMELCVPEGAVDAYRNADGWREFYSIRPNYGLECSISDIKALRAGTKRSFILLSEGKWMVESMPGWCTLSQTEGENSKTLLTLDVQPLAEGAGNRQGEIVFRLSDNDYSVSCAVTQYDYDAEGKEINLQMATKGKGIQMFLLGDGFDAQDIAEGRYLQAMETQMNNFFDIEPYRAYRDYFTVHTALAESPDKGIGSVVTTRETRFGTNYDNSFTLFSDYDAIRKFVVDHSSTINENNLNDAIVVLVTNSDEFSGQTEIWNDGSFISICPLSKEESPYDARSIIQHEAGGHGFAKLGDESVSHYDFITACCCPMCQAYPVFMNAKSHGWYQNLSLSAKISDLPWAHLIYDSRYSKEVDVFEGGYNHERAVYRSEISSIMKNYQSYFNAISRETIVRRILELAGEEFDFETFVAIDLQNRDSQGYSRSPFVNDCGLSGNVSRHREPRFHN